MKDAFLKLLVKSERSIKTAESLLESDDIEFVAGRAYYAMFYIVEALLNEKDLLYRKHSGVHSAFGKHFVKTGEFDQKFHRWLLEAFNKRLMSDYSFEANITKQEAEEMIERSKEFLQQARQYRLKS